MTAARQLDLLKGKRQRGVKPKSALEFRIHVMVADTLRISLRRGWWWCHIPNGEKRDDITAAKLQRMGVKPGIADFMLIDPVGRLHFLELKREKGKLTDAQALFQAEMKGRGVSCAMADTFKTAIDQLHVWGAVRATVSA